MAQTRTGPGDASKATGAGWNRSTSTLAPTTAGRGAAALCTWSAFQLVLVRNWMSSAC
jgi:hypothetical protein